jgi:hypothetical protein
LSYSNLLKRYFHPLLLKCGIEKQGLHGFRRYRDTYLRNRTNCPGGVYKFWLGHSTGGDMSEHYDKIGSDKETQFRREVAASVGHGFTLPEQSCEFSCSKGSELFQEVESRSRSGSVVI